MTDQDVTRTSTGHELSESGYLDSHFEAMKPEYEAMIRSVGIKSGWSVLDAGCGGGSFLPILAELVGSGGHISAYDLAPEHIGRIKTLVENPTTIVFDRNKGWRSDYVCRMKIITSMPSGVRT